MPIVSVAGETLYISLDEHDSSFFRDLPTGSYTHVDITLTHRGFPMYHGYLSLDIIRPRLLGLWRTPMRDALLLAHGGSSDVELGRLGLLVMEALINGVPPWEVDIGC